MEKITRDSGLSVKFVETSGYKISWKNLTLLKVRPAAGMTAFQAGVGPVVIVRDEVERIVSHVRNLDAKREVSVTMAKAARIVTLAGSSTSRVTRTRVLVMFYGSMQ